MKIAVDAQSIRGRRTGIGTAAFHLTEAMRALRPDWKWLLYDTGRDQDFRTPERIAWESARVPARVLRDRPQLLYVPGFAPPVFSPAPCVATVHDLMGLVDSAHLPPAARFYWSQWLPGCLKNARVLVASSESTKRDIVRYLGRRPESIEVVPLGAAPHFLRPVSADAVRSTVMRYLLESRPYFLAVSTLEPRKNAHGLLRAFQIFRRRCPDGPQLAFAGKAGGHEQAIMALIRQLDLEKDVKLLGYVPDEDLPALYRGATAYAFVSFYEGFGLPVLEAMTCGRTGVASNAASIPEVAWDSALYADPAEPESIAEGLIRLWQDESLRRQLEAKAAQRSRQFSWEKAAGRMTAIFQNAL